MGMEQMGALEAPPSGRVSDTFPLWLFHYYTEFSEIEG
jgi:hypothetical protein